MSDRLVEHSELTPRQKIEMLCAFFISSGIGVNAIVRNKTFGTVDFNLTLSDGSPLLVHAIIKNISSGGWSWKPYVKRIQVKTFAGQNLPPISDSEVVLLGGFAVVDGEYVYAAWNIFAYMTQKTVRSCYVDVDNLIEAKDRGFFFFFYANNRVYLSNKGNMSLLLETFIRQNKVTKI